MLPQLKPLLAVLAALAIGGCASIPVESSIALDAGRCQALRAELDAADARGAPALAEKASNGGQLSAEQRQQADAYNDALQAYLGGACHTAGKP